MPNRLHCKFCDFSTLKVYTNGRGKIVGVESAQRRLMDHIMMKHFSEWEKVQAQLKEMPEEEQ